jgi:4-phospho-D-threonate 3-dehydrogenase / 4-phospho-D-erythronate 3-dehydrogenase
MLSPTRPLLAITMGDPAGIGPEIVLKALAAPDLFATCRPLIVGDQRMLLRAADYLGYPTPRFELIEQPQEGHYTAGSVPLLDMANADPAHIPIGELSAGAGAAAVAYVEQACDLAMAGAVDGLVTAPLNKAAMHLAGFDHAGHTELLQTRTRASRVSMLLVGHTLRVVHVSTHVALHEAIKRVTVQRVGEVIELAAEACRQLGIVAPRIAVAGLNPHAGEGGLFGNEEATAIMPAIEAARAKGHTVSDPQAPDTVFLQAVRGKWDIVVAMYHDQGHIPMKLLAFDSGVNVSLGLPIIRTSVDHGTAFDIAGTGKASVNSLLAAISVAIQMVQSRQQKEPNENETARPIRPEG